MKQLEKGIGHIDLVVEVRDARIPITSTNKQFELSLGKRNRLVVFNKYDLADLNMKNNLIDAFKQHKQQNIAFTSLKNDTSVMRIIQYAISK